MAEAAPTTTRDPRAPRAKRVEEVPVPREFVGQTKSGFISDVLKTRRGGKKCLLLLLAIK
jgi:hypothetical protein